MTWYHCPGTNCSLWFRSGSSLSLPRVGSSPVEQDVEASSEDTAFIKHPDASDSFEKGRASLGEEMHAS